MGEMDARLSWKRHGGRLWLLLSCCRPITSIVMRFPCIQLNKLTKEDSEVAMEDSEKQGGEQQRAHLSAVVASTWAQRRSAVAHKSPAFSS